MRYEFVFPKEKFLLIGTVAKPHGLKGEVCVLSLSGQPESLRQYRRLVLVDNRGNLSPVLTVTSFKVKKDRAIIGLDRVIDRDFAEKICGMGVLLDRMDLPEPERHEFYWHELEGHQVQTRDGRQLGSLQGVFSNGAQDVMVVGDDHHEYLIPVVEGIIVSNDNELLVIDPPPGLLEINSDDNGSLPSSAAVPDEQE